MQLQLSRTMSNQELAQVFRFISGVLALQNANRFRVRAYDTAADTIESYPKELHQAFLTDTDFDEIPGIGETISAKLSELFTTGTIKAFQNYVKDIPNGAWSLTQVHGLGVKRGVQLADAFDTASEETALDDILKHAQAGEVAQLPGWGEKSQQDLITNIQAHQQRQNKTSDRIPYKKASQEADKIIRYLIKNKVVDKAEPLGSLRRQSITVGDIDIGIQCQNMKAVERAMETMESVENVQVAGEQVVRVFLKSGIQVDLKRAEPEEWGSFLQHFTGSKEHNIKLREFALKQGKSLSEHGIKEGGKLQRFADEKEFYKELSIKWMPPEERDGTKPIIPE